MQESALLQAASPFYKTFAIDCSRAQVSVDMFLFSQSYQDVASLGMSNTHRAKWVYANKILSCSLFTALYLWSNVLLPCVQTLPGPEDALKFAREFGEVLASAYHVRSSYARPCFNAVSRLLPNLQSTNLIPTFAGLRMSSFHGQLLRSLN